MVLGVVPGRVGGCDTALGPAGAPVTEVLLGDHLDVQAVAAQRRREREPADPGADDKDVGGGDELDRPAGQPLDDPRGRLDPAGQRWANSPPCHLYTYRRVYATALPERRS